MSGRGTPRLARNMSRVGSDTHISSILSATNLWDPRAPVWIIRALHTETALFLANFTPVFTPCGSRAGQGE